MYDHPQKYFNMYEKILVAIYHYVNEFVLE